MLIQRHLHYTGSERARRILDHFDKYRNRFVKVMPMEYRRALQEMAAARNNKKEPAKAERVKHG
jgi:glutamate synthase (NADPH/NADH) large chain